MIKGVSSTQRSPKIHSLRHIWRRSPWLQSTTRSSRLFAQDPNRRCRPLTLLRVTQRNTQAVHAVRRRLQLDARRVGGQFGQQVADGRNRAVFVHRVHHPHETPGPRFWGLEQGDERLEQAAGGEKEFFIGYRSFRNRFSLAKERSSETGNWSMTKRTVWAIWSEGGITSLGYIYPLRTQFANRAIWVVTSSFEDGMPSITSEKQRNRLFSAAMLRSKDR